MEDITLQEHLELYRKFHKNFFEELKESSPEEVKVFYDRVRKATSLISEMKFLLARGSFLRVKLNEKRFAYQKKPIVAGAYGFSLGIFVEVFFRLTLDLNSPAVISLLLGSIAYFRSLSVHLRDYLVSSNESSLMELRIDEQFSKIEDLGIDRQQVRQEDFSVVYNYEPFSEQLLTRATDEEELSKSLQSAQAWVSIFEDILWRVKKDPGINILPDPKAFDDRFFVLDSERAEIDEGIPK